MGDRYEFSQKCPKCLKRIQCYYAESCGHTITKCPHCGAEFTMIIDFKLEEKKLITPKE